MKKNGVIRASINKLLGYLAYVSTATRPDIAAAVVTLSPIYA